MTQTNSLCVFFLFLLFLYEIKDIGENKEKTINKT